jgi:hypothetical protein
LLAAGHEPWIRYLPNRFFSSEPACELLATASLRQLRGLLDRFRQKVDLTIVRVNRWSESRLFRYTRLTVPEWVGMNLAVPGDLGQFARSGSSLKSDLALVRRYGYRPLVARSAKEFDIFYHSVYVPFLRSRYGELAFIQNYHDMERRLSSGGILWVERKGERVAAGVFELKSRTLCLYALGTMKGDFAPVKEGALSALYYFLIQFARDHGFTEFDMRGSRPSLHDGLLRYKRKWGASLYDMKDCYYDLLVGWEDPNQIVREFFTHTPLIFRENGRLSALVGGESGNPIPSGIRGLHRMHLITESGLHSLQRGRRESRGNFD